MYLEPTIQRKKKRRSSPVRVIFLLILISAGIYVYTIIQREEIESPFIPTPMPTRSAFSYVAEAEELYLQGHITQTIAAYERAIALEPGDVLPYIPLARLLILEERTNEGLQRAEQATRIAPENTAAWAILGMAHDWNGNVTEAINACNRAIELDPTYAEAYSYLAEAYVDAGRWADANETIQTALQLDDRNVDVHRNHGYVLEIQGNYWNAVDAYQRALDLHPNLAHLHLAIGRNYRRLGDIDAAVDSFQHAVEVNPGSAQAHFELGWTHLTIRGDYEQAKNHLERAVEANPQFGRAYGGLAITYWQSRDYEDAIPNFERAIELITIDSRENARSFYVTIEEQGSSDPTPSLQVVMRGDFAPASADNQHTLRATLTPERLAYDDTWADARGAVILDAQTGKYSVEMAGLPAPDSGQTYAGWFDGVNTLSGYPLGTGPLHRRIDGSIEAELEAAWVQGPAIDYFYTLGLAYFYLAECDKAYPLFDAALQIDPEETNTLEGIRLCRIADE